MKKPEVNDLFIDRSNKEEKRGRIDAVPPENTDGVRDRYVVTVTWNHPSVPAGFQKMLDNDPEIIVVFPSDWSESQKAWIVLRTPEQDEWCFDKVNYRIGKVWGVSSDLRIAHIIWGNDIEDLTQRYSGEVAKDEAGDEDMDESELAEDVAFEDMAYVTVMDCWNVLSTPKG